jgi:hypothetical protein
MSNYHFKEKKMSLKAKGLLSLMLSLPDDWNYSISGLVKLSKDGKDSVMSALSELEKFGYLSRSKVINEKGQFSGMEYNIFEEPQQDIPVAEKQHAENPNSVKSNSGNPPQLNTKLTKYSLNKRTNKLNIEGSEDYIAQFQDILQHIDDIELRNLFVDYVDMRVNIGSPITRRALSMTINRCARLSNFNIPLQREMVELAIINNWKSIHLPSTYKVQPQEPRKNSLIKGEYRPIKLKYREEE